VSYEELKHFILNVMKPDKSSGEEKNYQPVMILTLNQNNGKASKSEILSALSKHNDGKKISDDSFYTVYETLRKHHVVEKKGDFYYLVNYDKMNPAEKAHITMICGNKILIAKNEDKIITPKSFVQKFFTAVGPWENWKHTLANKPIRWGIKPEKSNIAVFNKLNLGDIVFFYVTGERPSRFSRPGWFGFGRVSGINPNVKKPYWPDERRENKVIYTHQLEIEPILKKLSNDNLIPSTHGLPITKGLNHIANMKTLQDFFKMINENWDVSVGDMINVYDKNLASLNSSESESFEKLILDFDKDRNLFEPEREPPELIEKLRRDFITRFQIEKVAAIRIDDYVLGKPDPRTGGVNRNTFCYYLENGVPGYGGIGGTPATKFGIYYSKPDGNYRWRQRERYDTPAQAFSAVRKDLERIAHEGLDFQKYRNWSHLSASLDDRRLFIIERHVISKILALYFPDLFLDIHSRKAIIKILKTFGISTKGIEHNLALLQSEVLKIKNKHPIMNDWPIQDFSHFIWQTIVEGNVSPGGGAKTAGELPPSSTDEHFLLRYNPPALPQRSGRATYDDELGREYKIPLAPTHFVNREKIGVGSKTIWFETKSSKKIRFWGYGIVTKVEKNKLHKLLLYDDFCFFDEVGKSSCKNPGFTKKAPYPANPDLEDLIRKKTKFNNSNSINNIPTEVYDEIIGYTNETFSDTPLPIIDDLKRKNAKDAIAEELIINNETVDQIIAALVSGKNVLLVGPIGTGKTHLAQIVPKIAFNYHPHVETATSDWTTHDVIGGIVPRLNDDEQVKYAIQMGCVSRTVSENWEDGIGNKRKFVEIDNKGCKNWYRGQWLVIDEFNRANIDRAFGQMFTAVEYKELLVPSVKKDLQKILIPEDYRIIGTLNTFDKHYLFRLSDALKRRFAVIEVNVPEYDIESKQLELYFVAKKALNNLEPQFTKLAVDFDKKRIAKGTDAKAEEMLDVLYELISFLREIKPLGTAVMISMFRFMIIHHKLAGDWERSLDLALTSSIVPQLETLQQEPLKVIRAFFCRNPARFFNELDASKQEQEKYLELFVKYVRYLNKLYEIKNADKFTNKVFSRFKDPSKSLSDDDIKKLNPWKKRPTLTSFEKEISQLISEKGIDEFSELEGVDESEEPSGEA